MKEGGKALKQKTVSYRKYGYQFIAPFFLVYLIFSLWPLLNTFYCSLFEYTTRNLHTTITFTGLQNYKNVLGLADGEKGYFLTYMGNTLRMWLCNFVPQMLLSMLAAVWLTNNRAKLRARGFYKVVLYMPNNHYSSIHFLIVLCTVRRGSASVDVLSGAKRSCGVRSSGGKLDWYSGTGM